MALNSSALFLPVLIICILLTAFVYYLYRKSRLEQDLLRKTLEDSLNAVCITDASAAIEYVNQAYCSITGFSAAELTGKNPRIMKSGRHDSVFYKKMWDSLLTEGHWEGEIWDRKKDGQVYPKYLTISAYKNSMGKTIRYVGVFSDLSAIKQSEEHIEKIMHTDALTGLANRISLREHLNHAISHARKRGRLVAVVTLNIDQFRKINNALGYSTGDQLLQEAGHRLRASTSSQEPDQDQNIVARLGADEFAVILADLKSQQDAVLSVQKIIDSFHEPFVLKNHYDVIMHIRAGVALYPVDGENLENLLKSADTAMNFSREEGRSMFRFYSDSMSDKSFEALSIETNLRRAFEHDEFVLYYQPLGDFRTGQVVGMEALIRKQEPDWLAPPGTFIQVAEKTGLISQMCEWTLSTACRQAMHWQKNGLPPLRLSVNFTATQFYGHNLIDTVKKTLDETGFPPQYLELELTERIIVHDTQTSLRMMHALRDMGVRLSIDDFGTGYSSLSYLKKFPVDKLKIDISFVRDIPNDPDSNAIAMAIIALAHAMNMKVIAEGIEHERQYNFLKDHGCDEIQGYFFSVPLSVDAFQRFVRDNRKTGS